MTMINAIQPNESNEPRRTDRGSIGSIYKLYARSWDFGLDYHSSMPPRPTDPPSLLCVLTSF